MQASTNKTQEPGEWGDEGHGARPGGGPRTAEARATPLGSRIGAGTPAGEKGLEMAWKRRKRTRVETAYLHPGRRWKWAGGEQVWGHTLSAPLMQALMHPQALQFRSPQRTEHTGVNPPRTGGQCGNCYSLRLK